MEGASSVALALPAFLVGTLLIYVFAVRGELVPTSGWDGWRAKILPTVTLGLVPLAYCARLTRGAVLETLREDYVRTAARQGLRGKRASSSSTCCGTHSCRCSARSARSSGRS